MNLNIDEQNAAFEALSNKEKRIAIAEDVLSQLDAMRYKAVPGCYRMIDHTDDRYASDITFAMMENLQATLFTLNPVCQVCALGGAFLSAGRLGGKINYCDNIYNSLIPIFGDTTVELMEAAFEKDPAYCRKTQSRYLVDEAIAFGATFADPRDRIARHFYQYY